MVYYIIFHVAYFLCFFVHFSYYVKCHLKKKPIGNDLWDFAGLIILPFIIWTALYVPISWLFLGGQSCG